jgi:hypothetical protein
MSKTYRYDPDGFSFRRPKTKRERTQNVAVEADARWEYDYPVDKANRRHRHIPTDYDDIPVGG